MAATALVQADEANKAEPEKEANLQELEVDAVDDERDRVASGAVAWSAGDATLNVMQVNGGKLLMSVVGGSFQYLLAGLRCTAGVKTGRYMLELRIVENLQPLEAERNRGRTPEPRNLVCLGVSLAGSSLLADTEDCVCFDSEGYLFDGKSWSRNPVCEGFVRDQTVALVINLDISGPNAHTLSLFRDGQRISAPQKLPESLRGKVLYPTITYKNVSMHVNLGPVARAPLPFSCRMLQDATAADIEYTSPASEQKPCEVVFPVGLPDQGLFDYVDSFIEQHPQHSELSDRRILDWGIKSGLCRAKGSKERSSIDKPDLNFGIAQLDEVRKVLHSLAPATKRDYMVMELRGNLLSEERRRALQRFSGPSFKKVALVLMGEPSADYKQRVQELRLKEQSPKAEAAEKAGEPDPVELGGEGKQLWYRKSATSELSQSALLQSYASFTLPTEEEGFDEVKFLWQPKEKSETHLREWVLELKRTLRVEEFKPSAWFREQYATWTQTLQEWKTRQSDMKDPAKRKKAQDAKKRQEENGDQAVIAEAVDIDSVEDVTDIGDSQPLFSEFVYEDWTLLSTRFELHLLIHAFRKALDDADRPSFREDHLYHYFEKLFGKKLELHKFNVEKLADLLKMIEDSICLSEDNGMLETKLSEDVPHSKFVKLTEEHRRDRMHCMAAGDETAQLRFQQPEPERPPATLAAHRPPLQTPLARADNKSEKGKGGGLPAHHGGSSKGKSKEWGPSASHFGDGAGYYGGGSRDSGGKDASFGGQYGGSFDYSSQQKRSYSYGTSGFPPAKVQKGMSPYAGGGGYGKGGPMWKGGGPGGGYDSYY